MAGASLGIGLGMAQMIVRDQQGGNALVPAAAGVVCGSCSASVPPGKFCSSCGTSLERKPEEEETENRPAAFCTSCGSPMAPDARFCGQCGKQRDA